MRAADTGTVIKLCSMLWLNALLQSVPGMIDDVACQAAVTSIQQTLLPL